MTLLIFIVSLLGAMAIGAPVAFALIFCGVVLMSYMGMFNTQIIAQNMLIGADTFTLLAIPFFILAGIVMQYTGISQRLVDLAFLIFGRLRHGLAAVTIISAFFFSAISGSGPATVAAIGAILMRRIELAPLAVARGAVALDVAQMGLRLASLSGVENVALLDDDAPCSRLTMIPAAAEIAGADEDRPASALHALAAGDYSAGSPRR